VLSRGGVTVGEVDLTRNELERSEWRVSVPADIEQRLQAAGQVPYAEEGTR
jgi:hypothetical protein